MLTTDQSPGTKIWFVFCLAREEGNGINVEVPTRNKQVEYVLRSVIVELLFLNAPASMYKYVHPSSFVLCISQEERNEGVPRFLQGTSRRYLYLGICCDLSSV